MNALLTVDAEFNEKYFSLKIRRISFKELLSFVKQEKYMSALQVNELGELYENSFMQVSLSMFTYDPTKDATLEMKKIAIKLAYALDDYLFELNNPYECIKVLTECEPTKLIQNSMRVYEEQSEIVLKEYESLVDESKFIWTNSKEFKGLVEFIGKKIRNPREPWPTYFLMDKRIYSETLSLSEISKIIKDVKIEVSILKHFEESNVVTLCKSYGIADLYKNITTTALCNYIFNYLYKGITSIIITEDMFKISAVEIRRGMISEDDYHEAINNPELNLTEEEKEYIDKHFKHEFISETINAKYVDNLVVTRKRK